MMIEHFGDVGSTPAEQVKNRRRGSELRGSPAATEKSALPGGDGCRTPAMMRALQRLAGNRAVTHLVMRGRDADGHRRVIQRWYDHEGNDMGTAPKIHGYVLLEMNERGDEIWGPPGSRTKTKQRRDYWEDKVSENAKLVCHYLDSDWWDLMPKSSPHLTLGTGTGGAAGHQKRDGDMMNALKDNADKLYEKRFPGLRAGTWGDMLKNLEKQKSAIEIKEQKTEEKMEIRSESYAKKKEEERKLDLKQKSAATLDERDARKKSEKGEKDQARRVLYKKYEQDFPGGKDFNEYEECARSLKQQPTKRQFEDWLKKKDEKKRKHK